MGKIRSPIPVKLFIGMLSPDPSLFESCAELLRGAYGPIDLRSEVFPWGNTDYYRDEMGSGIARQFVFLERLIDPDQLPDVKIFTNEIENTFATASGDVIRRRVNLDPGYVTEAKVVLASTKDFSHRVYIGKGIYAEVTLRYSTTVRRFTDCDHTYPDFRTDAYKALFITARDRLRASLRRQEHIRL